MWARNFKSAPSGSSSKRPTNLSGWIRQVHRWLAMSFTLVVITVFILLAVGEPPMWLYYTPLPFLFLLMFTGLYMFVLPYVRAWRRPERQVAKEGQQ